MKIIKYLFIIPAVFSLSTYTMSDRQSTQFQVKMKINEICNIGTGSTSNIDFGTTSRNTQNIQATGSLNVLCTNGTPYNISLNNDGTLKNTQDGSLKLSYRLYQDASMSKEWGNSSENRFSQRGTGQTQNITIWGKVPETNVPSGQYIDTVTATITY